MIYFQDFKFKVLSLEEKKKEEELNKIIESKVKAALNKNRKKRNNRFRGGQGRHNFFRNNNDN